MIRIEKIEYIESHWVKLYFSVGFEKKMNLKQFPLKGFAKELLDLNKFKEYYIEPGGGIVWPNGFDICPNKLRQLAEDKETLE